MIFTPNSNMTRKEADEIMEKIIDMIRGAHTPAWWGDLDHAELQDAKRWLLYVAMTIPDIGNLPELLAELRRYVDNSAPRDHYAACQDVSAEALRLGLE